MLMMLPGLVLWQRTPQLMLRNLARLKVFGKGMAHLTLMMLARSGLFG